MQVSARTGVAGLNGPPGPSPSRAEPSGCDRPPGRVDEDPPSDQNSEMLLDAGCADAAAGRVGGLERLAFTGDGDGSGEAVLSAVMRRR